MVRPKSLQRGSVLLVVLIVVMTISVLSMGFVAKSDVELQCGENSVLRMEMDYLAESGLEHARGMLQNPQDAAGEYWTGGTKLQVVSGSSDYYDVSVEKTGRCNYLVKSTGYRLVGGERVGATNLQAEVRLDPCIAWRVGDTWTSDTKSRIYGDVYGRQEIRHNTSGDGIIYGDAYASDYIAAWNIQGRVNEYVPENTPVAWPMMLNREEYRMDYFLDGNRYTVGIIDLDELNEEAYYGPTSSNPKGVYYRDGNLKILDDIVVEGTLIVKNDLEIKGSGDLIIVAKKNWPALVMEGRLKIREWGRLQAWGMVGIKDKIEFDSDCRNARIMVYGAVWVQDHNMDVKCWPGYTWMEVIADPDRAALEHWLSPTVGRRWSPVAGAFYKSVERL